MKKRSPVSKLLRGAALLVVTMVAARSPLADERWAILERLKVQAKAESASFAGFSAERGSRFFHFERTTSKGQPMSCATCHTADPKNKGRTRANKQIEPMAVSANPERFTDPAKVDKWFRRNCNDVYERACTAREMGDFIEYLISVR